jgi:hypothetical protein
MRETTIRQPQDFDLTPEQAKRLAEVTENPEELRKFIDEMLGNL